MINIFKPIFFIIGTIIRAFDIPIKQGGFKIRFPKIMTNWELGSTLISEYEKDERKLIVKYMKPDDSVLEMGACIGVVSLTINKILLDKTKQVSIEPNPQMHEYLYTNRENNNGFFNIETCIISKLNKVDFFIGGKAFLGSSTLNGEEKIEIPGKSFQKITDEYFEFTVIVMDIEGGELEFFRSFDLTSSKVRLIIWETHLSTNMLTEKDLNECYEKLNAQGFHLEEKSANVEAWIRDVK
jgi:FkbM family methyltransferase|tara:strand:- start:360 stop:1079 length:720 start_codon:yes stop_codon:yes gene_type:complete